MAGPATLYQAGVHGSRPANGSGCVLYSCTTHDLVYRDDGTSWTTFMTLVGGSGGDIATDTIWDAAGDLAQGTGANTAAKLGAGLAGQTLRSAGAAAANAWAYPPGYEFDYVQITSDVSVTAVDGVGFDTVVTGNAIAYDGSTVVVIEFYCNALDGPNIATGNYIFVALFDGATQLGTMAINLQPASVDTRIPCYAAYRLTPSAATHTYAIKAAIGATGTGTIRAGAGTSNTAMPAFIRISKV